MFCSLDNGILLLCFLLDDVCEIISVVFVNLSEKRPYVFFLPIFFGPLLLKLTSA